MTDHDQLESIVAAWVLGACDTEEATIIEAHVETCVSCRRLAARLGRVVEAMPLSVETGPPPAGLRLRLLAALDAPAVPEPEPKIVPLRRPRPAPRVAPAWLQRWPAVAVAVMAVAIAGLASWDWSLSQQLSTRGPVVYAMHGSGAMGSAQARVTYYPSDGFSLVDFSSMPALAPGKVYELWMIPPSGAPVAAGVFQPDAAGSMTVVVHRSMDRVKVVAVTVENGPTGTTAPTQQPELAATVS